RDFHHAKNFATGSPFYAAIVLFSFTGRDKRVRRIFSLRLIFGEPGIFKLVGFFKIKNASVSQCNGFVWLNILKACNVVSNIAGSQFRMAQGVENKPVLSTIGSGNYFTNGIEN